MGTSTMSPQQQQHQKFQLNQPEQIHMNQLKINKLKEKQLLLQQQINQQKQLEAQLRKHHFYGYEQQQQQNQQQNNHSEKQNIHSRSGEIYDTDAFLDPTLINNNESPLMAVQQSLSQQNDNSSTVRNPNRYDDDNGGGDGGCGGSKDASQPASSRGDMRRMLQRENSLKMESIFDTVSSHSISDGKKKYDASAMSMSGTSLSMGDFGDEGELSALFDTSMKIAPGNYTVGLNDINSSNHNRASSSTKHDVRSSTSSSSNGNSSMFGMSLATIGSTDTGYSETDCAHDL